jgi:hypothetical protein
MTFADIAFIAIATSPLVFMGVVAIKDVLQTNFGLHARSTQRGPFKCPHGDDLLCRKYGCPDDPNWKGDGCR